MLKDFFKAAWRNLLKNKWYSAINMAGLTIGLAVALLIGLWINDELSFDHYHQHYERLARVMDAQTVRGEVNTDEAIAMPLADALRHKYPDDFKHIALVYPNFIHTVAVGDKKLSQSGVWAEPDLPEMLTLKMRLGKRDVLKDPSSVLIDQSLARELFGETDPMNKIVRLDNMATVKVAGVFEDLPQNTTFYGTHLFLAWDKALTVMPWLKEYQTKWDTRYWHVLVEINEEASLDKLNAKIKDIARQYVREGNEEILLHPMSKWHLYNDFKNGKAAAGRIRLVWLFGIIGGFVLLLACINFMNLSTARSAGRAKEIGIRKAIGSLRGQLVGQFLSESLLVTFLALILAMGISQLSLPFFNRLTEKQLSILFGEPLFWALITGFTVFTGLVAGSYPAVYLSGFRPVKVLKGNFRVGRLAALPRKILIVVQFTVSVILIIGTIVVYRQIQYAKNRPVGYTRTGLITITMSTGDIYGVPYNTLRNELMMTGAVADIAKSSMHVTETPANDEDFTWKGKDRNIVSLMAVVGVTHDWGNTVGWSIKEGRDFSRNYPADSGSLILNEAAVKLTGFRHPVGEVINMYGKPHVVIGIAADMVMESPYKPVQPAIFQLEYNNLNAITIRIRPTLPVRKALSEIEGVFKRLDPGGAFQYQFTDEEYAKKFVNEERIGNLVTLSAALAVFISCLGLFGLASFTAEQRTREIGVRKVLGASVVNICSLLLKEFVWLVIISLLIASPLVYYFMHGWLQNYQYRTTISWWIFLMTGTGILLITLLTVSYQSIKAALMNPVKSLKTE